MQKWIPFWIWPMLLVFAAGSIWLRLAIVRKSYEIGQLNRLVSNARKEVEHLEVSVAQLKSPRRLKQLAKEKFQLLPPQSQQIIRLTEGQP